MQGKLSVPVRPTYLNKRRASAYCACSRYGLGFFLSRLSFLAPSPADGAIKTEIPFPMAIIPRTTNQPAI